MRVLAIRGRNLASLEGEFSIDFTEEPLASAGIFAISGPTGAGKSTLLDAMCLALFSRTPRTELAKENNVRLRDVQEDVLPQSDPRFLLRRGTASGYAEVDFVALNGCRYRARWSVSRAREKESGRLQAARLTLYNIDAGKEEPGTNKDLQARIIELIGLTFDQFTRSVLLAQNDFSTFLKAEQGEKASLLEKLTGTEQYSEISRRIFAKNAEAKEAYEQLYARVQDIELLSEEEVEASQIRLSALISTTMLSGTVFSAILSLCCIIFSRPILKLLQVDPSIMDLTVSYMRIIFLGLIFTFLYNFFSSTLRALGDSQTPLYFLIASSLLNIFGDLFFVIVLKMGSNGCAISTVISEMMCCVFCIIYIQKRVEILRLGRKWLVFDNSLLKKTISYGWVSAMQQATVQLGKIGIQAIVNTMGVSVAAAFAVVNRIDDFAYTPEQNIGHAMTALMAQNKGANEKKRMKEGFKCGMVLEFIYGIILFAVCFILARPLMLLFVKDEEVILHGVKYLRLISFMYILPAATNGIQGYFRGIGDLKITLLSSFINMGVRVIAAIPLVLVMGMGIEALPLSYLAGWIGMLIAELPLLIRNYRSIAK